LKAISELLFISSGRLKTHGNLPRAHELEITAQIYIRACKTSRMPFKIGESQQCKKEVETYLAVCPKLPGKIS